MTALLEYPFLTVLLEYLNLFLQTVSHKSGGKWPLPPMISISVGIFVNATILASTSVGTLATTFIPLFWCDVSATYSSCKIKLVNAPIYIGTARAGFTPTDYHRILCPTITAHVSNHHTNDSVSRQRTNNS